MVSLSNKLPKAKSLKSIPPQSERMVFTIIHGIAMLVMMMIKMTPTMLMKMID